MQNELLNGIKDGTIMGVTIIVIWYLYGMFVFRYDIERIKSKVATKWALSNTKLFDPDKEHIVAENVRIYKGKVTATIVAKDKITQKKLRAWGTSFRLGCNNILDMGCIVL